jgi:hypothetical protein
MIFVVASLSHHSARLCGPQEKRLPATAATREGPSEKLSSENCSHKPDERLLATITPAAPTR